jgi:hypothetical protein
LDQANKSRPRFLPEVFNTCQLHAHGEGNLPERVRINQPGALRVTTSGRSIPKILNQMTSDYALFTKKTSNSNRSKNRYRTEWAVAKAKRQRAELIAILGGRCKDCGTTKRLEFHHKYVRQWVAAKVSRWKRIALYWREYEAGEIELRCRHCNATLGKPKEFTPRVFNTSEEVA